MLWENLILRLIRSSIANHDSHSKLFIEVHSIDIVEILNIVEICDVNYIVPVELALDIYSLRIGCSSYKLEVSCDTLLVALLVTLCSESIDVTNVNLRSSDPADRALMNLAENCSDPSLIICNELRGSWSYVLVLWEQSVYSQTCNSCSRLYKTADGNAIVLQCVCVKSVVSCISIKC